MRNARLAERILSLVTTPERASATVGDLLEDRRHDGALRFWSAVLITTLSLLWQDVAASPLRMARLAVLGLLLQWLLSVGTAIGYWLFYAAFKHTWPTIVATGVLMLLAQFQVGRVLAKRSPGRELAPSVATTLLAVALPFLIVVLSRGRAQFPTGELIRDAVYGPSPVLAFLSQIPFFLVLLAGAARVRRQRLSVSS
jgi:hypothetical protein